MFKLIIEQISPAHQPNGQSSLKITSPMTSPEALWAGGLVIPNIRSKTKDFYFFTKKTMETNEPLCSLFTSNGKKFRTCAVVQNLTFVIKKIEL